MIKAILFMILVLAIYIGSHVYVSRRLVKLFELKRKKILYILFAVGAISFPLSMMIHRALANSLLGVYYLLSTFWIGLFLYLLLILLVFELINIFLSPPPKTSAIVIVSLALLIFLYSAWNAHTFIVGEETIPMEGLKRGQAKNVSPELFILTDTSMFAPKRFQLLWK